jgi:hypothetical protein
LFSTERPKVAAQDEHLSKVPDDQHLNGQRCWDDPLKVLDDPSKGAGRNPVTSANANTGLKHSGLNQSGLQRAAEADAAEERLIMIIIEEIKNTTGRTISADWAGRVKRTILDGRKPASADAYIRQAIRAEPDPHTRFLPISRPGYEP